jgi:hypothetical protein
MIARLALLAYALALALALSGCAAVTCLSNTYACGLN